MGPFLLYRQMGLTAAVATATVNWLEHRNNVPHWRGFLERGIVLDTVESLFATLPNEFILRSELRRLVRKRFDSTHPVLPGRV